MDQKPDVAFYRLVPGIFGILLRAALLRMRVSSETSASASGKRIADASGNTFWTSQEGGCENPFLEIWYSLKYIACQIWLPTSLGVAG